jgi:hypothetical protein
MKRHLDNSRGITRTIVTTIAFAAAVMLCSESFAGGHGAKSAAESHGDGGGHGDHGGHGEAVDNPDCHGILLGEYRIRSYYPVDSQKSTVRFSLYATVQDERFDDTKQLVEENHRKLRDQILTATRLSPLSVFQEPGLETFRRRILIRLRRALPELEISELYFSDFDLTIRSL